MNRIPADRRQIDIAEPLGLSERTAENHLRRIRQRLPAATIAHAVRVAIPNGFNDTGIESMDRCWNRDEQVVAHWSVRELNRQHDPDEMIQAIIEVIETEHPPYRTVKPASAEAMVKEQELAWGAMA